MTTQDPIDLPSKKPDRQEYFHEVYSDSPSTQLHSILEAVLEEERDRLEEGEQW